MFFLAPEGPYYCVNCDSSEIQSVFKTYGSSVKYHNRSPSTVIAGTNLLPKNESCRLTECANCKKPVDEYVQLDNNILFLDAILQKHSFYRHILLNCRISNKSAAKMSVIFALCEAIQRWTTLNGTVSASDEKTFKSSDKDYLQLEFSFYLIFLFVIIENVLFNVIFYFVFKLFLYVRPKITPKAENLSNNCNMLDIFISLIVCSYGKLFLIPSYLYAGDLKPIIDRLVKLFSLFSLAQCASVKGNLPIKQIYPFALVLFTFLLHSVFFNFILIPVFHYLTSSIQINGGLLEDYVV